MVEQARGLVVATLEAQKQDELMDVMAFLAPARVLVAGSAVGQ